MVFNPRPGPAPALHGLQADALVLHFPEAGHLYHKNVPALGAQQEQLSGGVRQHRGHPGHTRRGTEGREQKGRVQLTCRCYCMTSIWVCVPCGSTEAEGLSGKAMRFGASVTEHSKLMTSTGTSSV